MTPVGPKGFFSEEECQSLFDRCRALVSGGGDFRVAIDSARMSSVRWARSRAYSLSDAYETKLVITRTIRGAMASAQTNRVDDDALRNTVRMAERGLTLNEERYDTRVMPVPVEPTLRPTLWSDATYGLDAEGRGAIVRQLLEPAEKAGRLAGGELRVNAKATAVLSTDGTSRYYPSTRAAISTTVRDTNGTGSGWAGTDDFDVNRIDMPALAQRALDKCERSINPVAIEPGRYTVILEPQAVADFLWQMSLERVLERTVAEEQRGPFAGKIGGTSKITERVMDPRLTWRTDPMDPIGGYLPFSPYSGAPNRPVKWVDQGVLRELAYDRMYAITRLGRTAALRNAHSWRLQGVEGGTTSIDEMIATTSRGVLVTRLHDVTVRHFDSFTCTGYTRDGVWLIEKGKITKPVKNFRFTESPIFILNNVEQIGAPQRAYCHEWIEGAWVVPPIKVRDFNFTHLADAV